MKRWICLLAALVIGILFLFPQSIQASPYAEISGQIQADLAYEEGLTGRGVLVAVIDTGLDPTNPAYVRRIRGAYRVSPDGTLGTLVLSPLAGEQLHGTAQTGIIAGDYGATRGIAYEANLLLLEAAMDTQSLAYAIRSAVDMEADVINLSVCADQNDMQLLEACQYAEEHNVIVVASAGNTGDAAQNYPASYASVLSVASVNENLRHSTFSVYGRNVNIAAPGENLETFKSGGALIRISGTSAACAVVSGACALLRQAFPNHSAQQVRQAVMAGAVGTEHQHSEELGYGIIQIADSLGILRSENALKANTTESTAFVFSPYGTSFADGELRFIGDTAYYLLTAPEDGLYTIHIHIPYLQHAQIAVAHKGMKQMLIQMLENDSLAPTQSRDLTLDLLKGENAMIVLRYSQPCSYRIRIDGIREDARERISSQFAGIQIHGLAEPYLGSPILCAVYPKDNTLMLQTDSDRIVNRLTVPSDKLKALTENPVLDSLCFSCPYGSVRIEVKDLDPEKDLTIVMNRMVPYTLKALKAWTDKSVPHHAVFQVSVRQDGNEIPFSIPDSYWFEEPNGNTGFGSPDTIVKGPLLCWI